MLKISPPLPDEFKQAYLGLPLEERKLLVAWMASDNRTWQDITQHAGLLTGFRASYLRNHYLKMHERIDGALLRPARGDSAIPLFLGSYLRAHPPLWLDELRQRLARADGGSAKEVCQLAADEMEVISNQGPWAKLTVALCRLPCAGEIVRSLFGPLIEAGTTDCPVEDGEGTSPADGSQQAKGDSDSVPTDAAKESIDEADAFAVLRQSGARARELVDLATVAKPFDTREAHEVFEALHVAASKLREQVATLAAENARSEPKWGTLDELEQITSELKDLSVQQAEHEQARCLLRSVADVLRSIYGLKIRLRSRRDELLGVRQKAVTELDAAAELDSPPCLPRPTSSGGEWLRGIYGLSDEALDEVLEDLSGADFCALGHFVGHTSWDQLKLSEPPSPSESSAARDADVQPPVPATIPEEEACEVPHAEEDVAQPPQAVSAPPTLPETAPTTDGQKGDEGNAGDEADGTVSVQSHEPCPATDQDLDGAEATEPEPAPSFEAERDGAEAGADDAVQPASSFPSGSAALASGEPSGAPPPEDPEEPHETIDAEEGETPEEPDQGGGILPTAVLCRLADRGLWRLAAEYVRVAGQPQCLPPPAVFRILALHPLALSAGPVPTPCLSAEFDELGSVPPPETPDEAALWWAACVVPALGLPLPSARAILRALPAAPLPDCLAAVTAAISDLTDRAPTVTAASLRGGNSRTEWDQSLAELRLEMGALHENALRQTILYQPATEIWHWLNREGTLARLTKIVSGGDSHDVSEVRQLLDSHFRDQRSFQGLIDAADRKLYTRPRGIEARASFQIFERSRQFREIAERWVALQQAQPKGDYISENVARFRKSLSEAMPLIVEQLREIRDAEDSPLSDCVALAVTQATSGIDRLLAASPEGGHSMGCSEEATEGQLLRVPEVQLDARWRVLTPDDDTREAIERYATNGTDLIDAFRSRVASGDVRGARALIEYCEELRAGTAVDLLEGEIEQGVSLCRSHIHSSLGVLRQDVSALRSVGGAEEGATADVESELIRLAGLAETTNQYDVLQGELGALQRRVAELREERDGSMVQQLEKLGPDTPPEDIQRVRERIAAGDVLTAREYLGRLQTSGNLGELAVVTRNPLAVFFPGTAAMIDEELIQNSGQLRRALGRSGGDLAGLRLGSVPGAQRDTATIMLDAWNQLKKRHTQFQNSALANLLGHVGFHVLEVGSPESVSDGLVSKVRCEPIEDRRTCPVPRFGSACNGQYDVFQFWDRPSEESVLHAVGDRAAAQRPAIVLWYGRLTEARRRDLSRLCRERLRTFVLLDEILLAFLCSERGFRLPTFFQCSLPFTYDDPFVTAASLVPPEMFFGREKELADLQDTGSGSCFVYGGRQLGKTALLREAQRRFHRPQEGRYALWFDLLSVGVGTEKGPDSIWAELDAEFEALHLPGFEVRSAGKSGPSRKESRFEHRIRAWLTAHPEGRILLLLDETDRFLEQDAETEYSQARRLKGLMDATHRRFKVVLAGLHNVQRTTRQSNHPLAHLGQPISVGAFSVNGDWGEAMRLVTEPFQALGYCFERPALVTRILAICNFYPGLIQDFCSRLLQLMNGKRPDGPPFPISESDVEQICENPELRRFIESRFQLTLQLDPRYHVIAYTLALKFHEERERTDAGYLPAELQRAAADFWERGFTGMNPADFSSLLDEMRGLGVLRSQEGGKYALRNPNLLLLLGNEDKIMGQLLNAPREAVKYHPRTFHAKRRDSSSPRRNPLTIAQEGTVLEPKRECVLVQGSEALSMADLLPVLKKWKVSGVRALHATHPAPPKDFAAWLTKRMPERKGQEIILMVLAPSEHWGLASCEAARQVLGGAGRARHRTRLVFCVTPNQWWKAISTADAPKIMDWLLTVPVLKWHDDFIHRWLEECGVPIADPPDLDELLAITGGWPIWLYRFVDIFNQKRDMREAKSSLASWMADPANKAERLAAYGLSAGGTDRPFEIMKGVRSLLSHPDERVREDDMEVYLDELSIDEATFRAVLGWAEVFGFLDMDRPGQWTWDRVFVKELEP